MDQRPQPSTLPPPPHTHTADVLIVAMDKADIGYTNTKSLTTCAIPEPISPLPITVTFSIGALWTAVALSCLDCLTDAAAETADPCLLRSQREQRERGSILFYRVQVPAQSTCRITAPCDDDLLGVATINECTYIVIRG